MASIGAGAIEIQDLGAHTHTLQAFGPSGQLTRLDDAPVQALRVTRTEIVWMRDGIEHRAGLPR
jgi:hypothetical protein